MLRKCGVVRICALRAGFGQEFHFQLQAASDNGVPLIEAKGLCLAHINFLVYQMLDQPIELLRSWCPSPGRFELGNESARIIFGHSYRLLGCRRGRVIKQGEKAENGGAKQHKVKERFAQQACHLQS